MLKIVIAVVVVAGLSGCSRAPEPAFERLVILPFENLSGDPSLDWVASAGPAIVAADVAGAPKMQVLRASSVSDGYLGGATRFLHGYFTGRQGSLRFNFEVEDASRHKMVTNAAEQGTILESMNATAKLVDSSAKAFSTSNAEAVAAWGRRDFERAVAIDPDFGVAWLGWAESLAQHGDAAKAGEVADRALARPSLRSEVDRGRIEVFSAGLKKDPAGEEKALTGLAHLMPSDASVLAALAETALRARHFPEAVVAFRSLVKLNPENASALNLLGYTEGYAGDFEAARKTFAEYAKLPGQKGNSLDSFGEICFMNGQFAEAEKSFLEAHETNPALLNGGDIYKAAYSRWLNGDRKGADVIMARYLEFRTKAHDPIVGWREASWLYATGRREEALKKLQSVSEKQLVDRQLSVWNSTLSQDVPALKLKYESTPPSADGEIRTFYAAALLDAGQKDEARKLVTLWPVPGGSGDPLFESLMFPKVIEVRRAVGLPVNAGS